MTLTVDWVTVLASVLGAVLGALSSFRYQLRIERLRMKAEVYADAIDGAYAVDTELNAYLTWLEDNFVGGGSKSASVIVEGDEHYERTRAAAAALDSARARIRLFGPQAIFDVVQELLFEFHGLPNASRLKRLRDDNVRARIEEWRDRAPIRKGLRNKLVELATREVRGRRAKPLDLPPLNR